MTGSFCWFLPTEIAPVTFAETLSPPDALRAWLLLFVGSVEAKQTHRLAFRFSPPPTVQKFDNYNYRRTAVRAALAVTIVFRQKSFRTGGGPYDQCGDRL